MAQPLKARFIIKINYAQGTLLVSTVYYYNLYVSVCGVCMGTHLIVNTCTHVCM